MIPAPPDEEPAKPPVILDQGKIRVALGDPDTPGLVLFTIVLQEFGPAVMGDPEVGADQMDPSEMWAELNSRFGSWVTEDGENKLNAMITGLRGGEFWRHLPTFMAVSTSLFDGDLGDIITTGFEDLTATELMWSIMEMQLAWDAEDVPDYSLDIQEFVEEVLAREQESQDANAIEVEKSYRAMLDQLRELGVPSSMIRAWDEEYAAVMDDLEDGTLD